MAETYVIGWVVRGTTRIVADSAEEASAKMDRLTIRDLVETAELDVYEPVTEAEAAEAEQRFAEFMRGERENFLNG